MSTATRPRPVRAPAPAPPPSRPPAGPPTQGGHDVLTVALALLLLTALLPFTRVYLDVSWLRPTLGAAALSLGLSWTARRLDLGPLTALGLSLLGLVLFCGIVFLPATLLVGVLPTPATLDAAAELFVRGVELMQLRPSPTFAEAGLLFLTVLGVWLIGFVADALLFGLRMPTGAIAAATVIWAVPLTVAPRVDGLWLPVTAFLAAAAVLLLASSGDDLGRWGPSSDPDPHAPALIALRSWNGWTLATAAVVAGLVLASVIPGFGATPWYSIRGSGGTTITTNPIVDIRSRIVATDTGPVLRMATPRPLYLRTTSLDVYGEREEWTASPIRGSQVRGRVADPPPVPAAEVDVAVEIQGIEPGAILAPAPFPPLAVEGPKAEDLSYDPVSSTFTSRSEDPLVSGDRYQVTTAIPGYDVAALRAVAPPASPNAYTGLPSNVPAEVRALARRIVADAGATTMFDQALALQDELRTWSYSLSPQPGHGSTAMLQFIDAREGYCEQFAGTMAVMARTLGIPARLAVGYTPGVIGDDGRYVVTNANAHAWVEVLFGDLGWVAFEPTPRTDGNVLVPTAGDVVPDTTAGLASVPEPLQDTPATDPAPADAIVDQPRLDQPTQAPGVGAGVGDGGGVPWTAVVLGLLALVGVAGAGLVAAQRGTTSPARAPAERITRARARAERVGAAVGRPRMPWETDREYFTRLAPRHHSGAALAAAATAADYAPRVTAETADVAEQASRSLVEHLTGELRASERTWIDIRSRLPW